MDGALLGHHDGALRRDRRPREARAPTFGVCSGVGTRSVPMPSGYGTFETVKARVRRCPPLAFGVVVEGFSARREREGRATQPPPRGTRTCPRIPGWSIYYTAGPSIRPTRLVYLFDQY